MLNYHPPLPRTFRTSRTDDLLAGGWIYVKRGINPTGAAEAVDFGLLDLNRRALGARLTFAVMTVSPAVGGHSLGQPEELGDWFGVCIQMTRRGRSFGASQPTHWFRSEAEARAWASKSLEDRRKRHARKIATASYFA